MTTVETHRRRRPPRPGPRRPSVSTPTSRRSRPSRTPRPSGSTCSRARCSPRCTTPSASTSVSYDEYNALKAWLINVGQDGEWPLFLDVWVEHVVEDVATDHREGNKGSIEGPYYVPDSPEQRRARAPSRCATARPAPRWCGRAGSPRPTERRWRARSNCGTPTPTASTRSSRPTCRSGTCAARFSTGPDGTFEITTIRPAPYQIPTDGSCGKLISAAGWHAWRPAHLHVKVSAPGHELLTAQLYFPGDPHNDDDIASAVKPELILDPQVQADGTETIAYDFALDPEQS